MADSSSLLHLLLCALQVTQALLKSSVQQSHRHALGASSVAPELLGMAAAAMHASLADASPHLMLELMQAFSELGHQDPAFYLHVCQELCRQVWGGGA